MADESPIPRNDAEWTAFKKMCDDWMSANDTDRYPALAAVDGLLMAGSVTTGAIRANLFAAIIRCFEDVDAPPDAIKSYLPVCAYGDCKKEKEIYEFCEYHFVDYYVKKARRDESKPSASYVIEEIRRKDPSLIKSDYFYEEFHQWGWKGVSLIRVNRILKNIGLSKILNPALYTKVERPRKYAPCSICRAKGLQNCLCDDYGQFHLDYNEEDIGY